MLEYAKDIRPMFRSTDVDAIKPRGLDLWSYTDVSASADEILSRLWVAGVIPILVGLALIINGVFVSKKAAQIQGQQLGANPRSFAPDDYAAPRLSEAPDLPGQAFSVTESTTKHLGKAEKFKHSQD